jgi:hypothetical protein
MGGSDPLVKNHVVDPTGKECSSEMKTSFDVTHRKREIFAIGIKDHAEMMARDSYLGIVGSVGRCTSSTEIR